MCQSKKKIMKEWDKSIQDIILRIDENINKQNDASLTLKDLSKYLGYSEFYVSRKFKKISGMSLRDYLRYRKLAFALKDVRDANQNLLSIAVKYGFSSHEAFTRAFKSVYDETPSEYRNNPTCVVLRTIIKPFDCYLLETKEKSMVSEANDIKVYFVTIPAHKFLHIRNYESIGYCDFWNKQSKIKGQDCVTICGLLDSIKGKLDDIGSNESDASSGQIMALINEPNGRICSWGIPLAEVYGVRLPLNYDGDIPYQMQMKVVPEGEYIVFEHGPFNFEKENALVEAKIEKAMKDFDYKSSGYELDLTQGRVFYFYHDTKRFWKYIRQVKKVK